MLRAWSQSLPGLLPRVGESLGKLLPPVGVSIRLGGNPSQETPEESSFLRAVPKKKTSHQKKRQRQLAGGKQIRPLNNLNRCPACGGYKRAHTLCMRCVSQIKRVWKARDREATPPNPNTYDESGLHPVDKRILYPGKTATERDQIMKKKDYLYNRPKTLPVEKEGKKKSQVKRPRE